MASKRVNVSQVGSRVFCLCFSKWKFSFSYTKLVTYEDISLLSGWWKYIWQPYNWKQISKTKWALYYSSQVAAKGSLNKCTYQNKWQLPTSTTVVLHQVQVTSINGFQLWLTNPVTYSSWRTSVFLTLKEASALLFLVLTICKEGDIHYFVLNMEGELSHGLTSLHRKVWNGENWSNYYTRWVIRLSLHWLQLQVRLYSNSWDQISAWTMLKTINTISLK